MTTERNFPETATEVDCNTLRCGDAVWIYAPVVRESWGEDVVKINSGTYLGPADGIIRGYVIERVPDPLEVKELVTIISDESKTQYLILSIYENEAWVKNTLNDVKSTKFLSDLVRVKQ